MTEETLESWVKEEVQRMAPSDSLEILTPKNYHRTTFVNDVSFAVSSIASNVEEAKKIICVIFEKIGERKVSKGDGYHSHSQWWEEIVGVYLERAVELTKSPKKLYNSICEKMNLSEAAKDNFLKYLSDSFS